MTQQACTLADTRNFRLQTDRRKEKYLLPVGIGITELRQTHESAVQDAVNETGFGWFNFKIMAVSSLIFMNVAVSVMSIGFIMPAAACDFQMTTVDKGHLSASPMFGMLCGSYLWGCIADIKGRRISLLVALFLHGVAELLSSVMPSFSGLLFFKFVSGVAMNGQVTLVFVYLGEFQPTNYRDRFLSWMEMAWVTGMLISPGVAWMIIPLKIHYTTNTFFFHSWNLFVATCSLPALIIGTWLIFLPETPKYLAESGHNAKLLDVLVNMYTGNTGKTSKDYLTKLQNCGNNSVPVLFAEVAGKTERNEEVMKKSLRAAIKDILSQTMTVVKYPYLKTTILICAVTFLVMSSYYSLTLWLPELFRRFAEFSDRYPDRSASVCSVTIKQDLESENKTLHDPFGCDTPIHTDVYEHTLILAGACVPAGLSLPIFVDRLGYKFFLVFSTSVASITTFGLFLVNTSSQNLILTCIFEALTSVCNSLVSCILVDLYPTQLRAIAAGLTAFFSRVGAITGNLLIGSLIDDYCVPLIAFVGVQLFLCAILSKFIPVKRQSNETGSVTSQGNRPV